MKRALIIAATLLTASPALADWGADIRKAGFACERQTIERHLPREEGAESATALVYCDGAPRGQWYAVRVNFATYTVEVTEADAPQ